MDFSAVPLDAVYQLLAMYGEEIPRDPAAAYAAGAALAGVLPEGNPAPTAIVDWMIAVALHDAGAPIGTRAASEIHLSSEADLRELAAQLLLPDVNKERIMRVLAYLGLLENDMAIFDLLPNEALFQIAAQLDCRSLALLCGVSTRFAGVCRDSEAWRGLIRHKGYHGDVRGFSLSALQRLCTKLGKAPAPGVVYAARENADFPSRVPNVKDVTQVAAGTNYGLCLTLNGQVYGFGSNRQRQLGLPAPIDETRPAIPIPGLEGIAKVAAANYSSLCLATDGTLYAFGREYRFDSPLSEPTVVQMPAGTRLVDVAAGQHHALCLTADGRVVAFGTNSIGELGVPVKGRGRYEAPFLVPELNGIASVACGMGHSLCTTVDGRVYAFGRNSFGQLGLGHTARRDGPTLIRTLNNIIEVSGGADHSLFLTASGEVYACGSNEEGQLGLGHRPISTHEPQTAPVTISLQGPVQARAVAPRTEAQAPEEKPRATPVRVPGLPAISQIAAGRYSSLCLADSGQVYFFGNSGHQVGLRGKITYPALIPNLDGVSYIAADVLMAFVQTEVLTVD